MISLLRVLHAGRLVGQLAIQSSGAIAFQYDREWLVQGFDLAPGSIPFDGLANKSVRPGEFDGLPGAFYDSLPDGWGLLLMDRGLKKQQGLDWTQITPLDRLAYMGHRCMGALEYEPELLPEHNGKPIDLADIAEQAERFLNGETFDVLEELRIYGGSPGGARPKVTVAFSPDMAICQSGFRDIPTGYSHWIVKFRNDSRHGEYDPADIGRIEMAYSDMARMAGLIVPRTQLIEIPVRGKREVYFAAQRFDRDGNRKIHLLSLAGYAYANHRVPCMDYRDGVLPATRKLTKSDGEVEKAFRLMLFNVLTHNKDDHTKNFAYLHDPATGLWQLAPAFDLTFSVGIANNHTTSVGGAGNPTYAHLKNVAERHRIRDWQRILDDVRSAVAQWPKLADTYGLSKQRIGEIHKALKAIDLACTPR
ncbi:MAG: type II toxin-antitoxin system HipA family toxin [Sterolibacteriaceae bacterium MAG5]|nr:type II toxin-antitoxin system HipA family toxin [Candidatus Nitricoxidireducens bremensis]